MQRLALARALFVSPDVLLLGAPSAALLHPSSTNPPPYHKIDEPTNHLDLHAVLWLQDYLLTWPGTVIVVSHAREFLNAVCTDVVHLQARTLTTYRGDYDCFEATRAERVRNATKAAEAASVRRQQVQAFIDRFRYNAKRAALVQSRIKALERMAEVRGFEVDPETVFRFPEPAEASGQLMSFDDVTFAYTPGGRTIFRDVRFGLDADSRLAIVGPNGIGKSTVRSECCVQSCLRHLRLQPPSSWASSAAAWCPARATSRAAASAASPCLRSTTWTGWT